MKQLLMTLGSLALVGVANAQLCGPSWLSDERSCFTKAPWENYLGANIRRLFVTEYFTLPSDKNYDIRLRFTTGRHYTILFYTGQDAMASGLELRDALGIRLEFDKVFGKIFSFCQTNVDAPMALEAICERLNWIGCQLPLSTRCCKCSWV